jgi:hypothetical protein
MTKPPLRLTQLLFPALLLGAPALAQSAESDTTEAPDTSDEASPTGDEASPTSDEAPPTSDEASPTSDEASPTSDEASPTSDEAPPTGDEAPPTGDEAPPTGDEAPPTGDEASPTGDEASPTGDEASPTSDEALQVPEPAKPTLGKFSLRYKSLNGARLNPLGLISSNNIGFRYRLYDSDNALLKNNFVGLSILPTLSGGFGRFGALAELQPLSVMRLWARVEAFYYWGIFNLFQSFKDASSDSSDSKQRELGALDLDDKRRNYATWGTQVTLGMDLMIKVGPVVGRSFSRLVRSDFNMRAGDRVFFEQLYDVLAPNHGFYAHNDTDLLGYLDLTFLDLLQGMRVVGGVRNSVTMPLYTDAHFAPDNTDRVSDNLVRRTFGDTLPIWRVGPLISFTLYDYPGFAFNQPTFFLGAQWHILHRWRTGADVPIFVPYTFLGFSFTGDLLT